MCSECVPESLLVLKRLTSILGAINCFETSASRERWRTLCCPLTAATGTPRARSSSEEDGLNYLVPLDSFDTRHLTITRAIQNRRCDQTCCEAVKKEAETPPHTDSTGGPPGWTPQSTRLESVLMEEEVLCDLDEDWASTDVIAPTDREAAWLRDRWQTGSPLRHQHTRKKKKKPFWPASSPASQRAATSRRRCGSRRGCWSQTKRRETRRRDAVSRWIRDSSIESRWQSETNQADSNNGAQIRMNLHTRPSHLSTHPPTHSLTRVYVLLLVWDMFPQSPRRLAIPTDTAALDEGRGGWWCCWSVSLLLTTDSHHLPPDPHTAGRAVRYGRKLSNAQKKKNNQKTPTSRNHASDEWTGDNQQRGDWGVTARLGVMPVHHLSAALKQSAPAEGRPV